MLREMVEMDYLLTEPVQMDDCAPQHMLGAVHHTTYGGWIRQSLAEALSGQLEMA